MRGRIVQIRGVLRRGVIICTGIEPPAPWLVDFSEPGHDDILWHVERSGQVFDGRRFPVWRQQRGWHEETAGKVLGGSIGVADGKTANPQRPAARTAEETA